MEEKSALFDQSYYVSKQVDCDFTFRDLITITDLPKRNEILKQFTVFTHAMNEQGIEFLDHSPRNTLIIDKGNNKYEFYLVDLNLMKFYKNTSPKTHIDNFRRLTDKKAIITEISKAYASLTTQNEEVVFK